MFPLGDVVLHNAIPFPVERDICQLTYVKLINLEEAGNK